jgi:hypothetical protein
MRNLDDDIRGSLERLTDPAGGTTDTDVLWGDLVTRHRKRRLRNGALAALPLLLVAVLAVGVFSARDSDDARSDVATGGADSAPVERWERLPEAPISDRTGAVVVATDDELVIWGGRDDSGVLNDGAAYSFGAGTWREISGPLSPRENSVAVWTGEEVLIWGGTTAEGGSTANLHDGASWKPATDTWTEFPAHTGAVNGVTGAAWTGDELILVGLSNTPPNAFVPSDTVAFDPGTGEWRSLDPSPNSTSETTFAAFDHGDDVLVAAVTDDVQVEVSRLDPTTGNWAPFPLTWLANSPLAAKDIAWTGTTLTFVSHDTPGTVFDPSGDGSASNIPATRSDLRLNPVALDNGIVTVGDRWFDTKDGSVDIYTGTWTGAEAVPEDLDGSALTIAHDGKLYAWNRTGYVWTPPTQPKELPSATGTHRVENIRVEGNGPFTGGTERVVIDFNEPIPVDQVEFVADITSVEAPSRALYTVQGTRSGAHVCDSVHSMPGTVDLLIPADWFADADAHEVAELDTVDNPAKFVVCGPHNGFIQYSVWGPLSAEFDDVTVTVSPDRTSIAIGITSETSTRLDPRAGQTVVAEFLDALRAGDVDAAAELWTGYPELSPDAGTQDRARYIEDLLADPTFTRVLRSDRTSTFVMPSTDGEGQVVTVLDARSGDNPPAAVAFLTGMTDDRTGMAIHRLPVQAFTAETVDLPAGYVQQGLEIAVPGVPVEGEARAFINEQEVPVEIDYDNMNVSVSIPADALGDVAVTVVTSSPELPGVRAFAVTVREAD